MGSYAGQHGTGLLSIVIAGILLGSSRADAQPTESSAPIGGITFDPPRAAVIRHRNRQTIKGALIGISSELLHFRLRNGRQFHYKLTNIDRVQTLDKQFVYSAATDTYQKLKERASTLEGVEIAETVPTFNGAPVVSMPQPDPPPMPRMVDPQGHHPLEVQSAPRDMATAGPTPRGMAAPPPAIPATNNGPAQAFHESDTFKIGFLVACIGLILLWWRNRVG